ncbi:MAG: methyl-accepting chemotaxis protein [Rickettsiales bacterium]
MSGLITVLGEVYLERTKEAISDSIREDANWNGVSPTLKPTLEPALAAYVDGAKQLLNAMQSLKNGEMIEAGKFVDIGDIMHDGTADLGEVTLDELDKLLEIRISFLKDKRFYILAGCGAALLLAMTLFAFICSSLTGAIRRMTETMKSLAGGNMDVEVPSTQNTNEIGNMAKAVLVFKNNMIETERLKREQEERKLHAEEERKATREKLASKFEQSVKGIVNMVASAATQLSQTAESLAHAINQSTTTVNSAASGASQTSSNVQSVAAAAEEMTSSIKEISNQVQNSNTVVFDSVKKAESADMQATSLSVATQKVKEVIGLISDIAGQINLLALNATIESARAGDAGKGFAVVASEVKNLASQTDKSVQEIDKVIQEMNNASEGIIVSLKDIKSSIEEISNVSSTIAAAVEEQSASANEIARNIASAAQGTEVISGNLSEVLSTSSHSEVSSQQVLEASKILSKQAEQLNAEVDQFLQTIRAA